MTTDEKNLIDTVEPFIRNVRTYLSTIYDVRTGSDFEKFTGLCDESVNMLRIELERYSNAHNIDPIKVIPKHGEMKHNPIIPCEYWVLQHTWAKIQWNGITIYADPTASQFQYLFDDLPEYYIGVDPPKWYYDDRKNPAWNGITRKLNESIYIPHKINGERINEGLIEFIQYSIWGRISDIIRVIISPFSKEL